MTVVRIDGTTGNDKEFGSAADELFFGGVGNDRFDGVSGTDTSLYPYHFADYSISTKYGDTVVRHLDHLAPTWEGTDRLTNVERLEFADKTVFLTPNKAPVAVADAVTGKEDTSIVIQAKTLLANDSDPDGDALAIASVGGATHGTVALSADGQTITFTPDHDYFGPTQFTYAVHDVIKSAAPGDLRSDTGTVHVTVECVPEAMRMTKTLSPTLSGGFIDFSSLEYVSEYNGATKQTVQYAVRDGDGTGFLDGIPNEIYENPDWAHQMVSDSYLNNIDYVLKLGNGDIRLTNTLSEREDQGVAEFSLADIPPTVQSAKLVFAGGFVDQGGDFSTFQFHIYAGDGAVTIADWNVTAGTEVSGAGIVRGDVPNYFTLTFDADIINTLIASGATTVAIHQKALDNQNWTQPQQGTYNDPEGTGEVSISNGETHYSQLIGVKPSLVLDYLAA